MEDQLKVLGKDRSSWKENHTARRLVGKLDALKSHIGAIKKVLPSIIEMYMAGDEQSDIAESFDLTTTRVGQIIRGHLGKHAKNSMLEKSLTELKERLREYDYLPTE